MSLIVSPPNQRSYPFLQEPLTTLPGALAAASLEPGPCLVITDANVALHYQSRTVQPLRERGWSPTVLVLPPGEKTKSADSLAEIYQVALSMSPSRAMPIIALGGGVIGDVAGYAAATLLRGLPLVQVPTSVIAQVDSSVGGKTGINHAAGKNLIGAFHHPRLVLADPAVLDTLPAREFVSGLAEVVKAALIQEAPFVLWLTRSWTSICARSEPVVSEMVRRSVAIKARIVELDEREAGMRMLLNFGHTFGHALERVTNYSVFTHGEAVALGMRAAVHLSTSRLASELPTTSARPPSLVEAEALIARLPVEPAFPACSDEALVEAMQTDKKRTPDGLRFVLLNRIGEAITTATVPAGAVRAAWASVRRSHVPATT